MLKTNSGGENARAGPDEAKQALASELQRQAEPEQPVYVLTKNLADATGLTLHQAGYHIRDAADLAGVTIERWSSSAPARWQIHATGQRVMADGGQEFEADEDERERIREFVESTHPTMDVLLPEEVEECDSNGGSE